MDTYAHVRVSTKEQSESRQMIAMQKFGAANNCIVLDKASYMDAAEFDRFTLGFKSA